MVRVVIRSEGDLAMARWDPSGDVRVEDVASGVCSEWLPAGERDLPLGEYALDVALDGAAGDVLEAEEHDGDWCVADASGQRWWPDEQSAAQIAAAADPAAEAIRVCREQPLRGEWSC